MGGSDFNAVNPYTYDDASYEDFNMNEFSINKDRDFVIPILKEILAVNPEVKIMASPWSAPAWMKMSGTLYGGEIKSGGQYHAAMADFFVRFIRAYQAEGIQIDTITLQNEPEHQTTGYMTMRMPWEAQRDIIRYHLGPRFRSEGITTGIVIWDHNWDGTWYPMSILNDPEAKQYVSGTGWHCYNGNRYNPLEVINAHPEIDTYFTECSGGDWDQHFGSVLGWNVQNLFIGQTRIGSRTVLLWNLALDQNHGPLVGADGCKDCRGVVTVFTDGRSHEKNVEYYSLGHFSQFVRPGAVRIGSSTYESEELESVAFQNPDGTVAVIVVNTGWGATTKTFQIHLDGIWYYYQNLPSRSVITFYKT
jgi:glucosylceramidase